MSTATTPTGYATLNPFLIVRDADGLLAFCRTVFGGTDRPEARAVDVDGLLLHAELEIGGATLMVGERKPGWPHLPQLTQVYVDDVDAALARARELGGTVVTEPTDLYGTTFSRLLDPWGNLWWVYRHGELPEAWEADGAWAADGDAAPAAEAWEDPGLAYIHRTLLAVMPTLGREPA